METLTYTNNSVSTKLPKNGKAENTVEDGLTPQQRAYWSKVIEEAHYDPNEPKHYITLEEFGRELKAAVRSKV